MSFCALARVKEREEWEKRLFQNEKVDPKKHEEK